MTPVIVAIVGLVGSVVTGVVSFLFGRRKNRAETISMELKNAQEVINIWRELSKEQDRRLEEQEGKLKEQGQQINEQNAKIEELQDVLEKLGNKYAQQCETCQYKIAFMNNKQK